MITAGYVGHRAMKNTALAALLATTMALMPWEPADASDFQYAQRLYSLGDYAGAIEIWRDLAQKGDARAQYSIAVMYRKGQGVAQDPAKALEWARQSAEQGYEPGRRLAEALQPKPKAAKSSEKAQSDKSGETRKPRSQMTELEAMEAAVEDVIAQIQKEIGPEGRLHHGPLQSQKVDGTIRVTVPDVRVTSVQGDIYEFGDVLVDIQRSTDRFDTVNITLPGEIPFSDRHGNNGRITVAERVARLTWDRQLQYSTEFEFRLGTMAFLLDDGTERARIGEILVKAEVKEKAGQWTGPVRLAITGVDVSDGKDGRLRLQEASMTLQINGVGLPEKGAVIGTKNAGDETSGGTLALQKVMDTGGGLSFATVIKGLNAESLQQGDFRLDDARYGLEFAVVGEKLMNIDFNIRQNGLSGSGQNAPEALLPRDIDINLRLENLPLETVINVGATAAIEAALLGQVSSGPEVFQKLRRDFSAAATVLRLKQASIKAGEYDIALAMTLLADADAKAGFVGGGDLRIRGLEKLLTALNLKDAPPIAEFAKKGQAIEGGRGQLFAIAARPDGQLTVNGDPVANLVPTPDKTK